MTLTRRAFIYTSAVGGALVVSFGRPLEAIGRNAQPVRLNPWIRVKPDGAVEIIVSQAEMGQGVHTTLPAIIAEEMDADWERVELVMSPVGKAYVNPRIGTQFTGNAESVRTFWPHLRRLGASARDVLVRAAARRWKVSVSACRTEKGRVFHGSKALSYGDLAAAASKIAPHPKPRLKKPSEWRLLRKSLPRTELREKVTGAPIFGIDVERPGMLYATVLHCPLHGGRFRTVDWTAAEKSPGVQAILRVPGRKILGKGSEAVIVVADRWWRARKALELIQYEVEGEAFSTGDLSTKKALAKDAWTTVETDGPAGPASGPSSGPAVSENGAFSAEFTSAWQAHAPMEPMNCTAETHGDHCVLWAPTQGQTMCVTEVSEALGIPAENVEVNRTFLGGGFGRRLIGDYAVQAALASRAVEGRPVKLIWTREQDIRHDHYRPEVTVRLAAELDDLGHPSALQADVVSASILSAVVSFRPPFRHPEHDPSCLEGLTATEGMRYGVGRYQLRSHLQEVAVATMVWRTTGFGPNVFALECFIDELAARAKADPIDYRRHLLSRRPDNDRAIAVLDKLRKVSGWTPANKRPGGRVPGVALPTASKRSSVRSSRYRSVRRASWIFTAS